MNDILNFIAVSLTLLAFDAVYLMIIRPCCKKRKKEPEEIFIRPKIDDE